MQNAALVVALLFVLTPSQLVKAQESDRLAAMEAELAELQAETRESLRSTPVTIDVHEADVRRVLVTLAEQIGGRAGFPASLVGRKITLAAQNSALSEVMDDLCTAVGCRWAVAMRDGRPLLSIQRGDTRRVYGTEVIVEPLGDDVYELTASIEEGDGGQVLARPRIRLRSGEQSQVGSTVSDVDILLSATIDSTGRGVQYSITISRDGAVESRHSASLKLVGVAGSSPNEDEEKGVCSRRGGEVRKLNPHGLTAFFCSEGNVEVFPCENLRRGEAPSFLGTSSKVGRP